MKTLTWVAAVTLSLAAAGCQTSDPASQRLATGENAAIVLLKVRPAPQGYSLTLSTYDEPARAMTAGSFGGFTTFAVDEPDSAYVAQKITPGTHIYAHLAQQAWWVACFQSATLAFDVKPGEVLYLGEFDANPHLMEIQKQALSKGHGTASSSDRHFYFDNIPPVQLGFGDDKERTLTEVSGFVRSSMPNVMGTVSLVEYRDAKFGNGFSLYGQPVCGGYFKGPATD